MQKSKVATNPSISPSTNIESERRESLLDRRVFSVTAEVYADFLARFDAPAQPNARLRRSLGTVATWEV